MDKSKAVDFIHDLLRNMTDRNGSDLFITAGTPPAMKVDGKVARITSQALTTNHTQVFVRSLMNDRQLSEFEETQEANFAIQVPGVSRFRVSAFIQQGNYGMVVRKLSMDIPTLESLNLPQILKNVSLTKRGLILVVGATGSGKSSTLAAMIGLRNELSHGHIITVEDPIEFVHEHKNCIVTQREVGVDTDSYHVALKNTLRQSPDVIFLGEVRDMETMEHAMTFAETGHLCLTTLHANSANQALERIVNFFPEERRQQLYMDLSLNLTGIVSQRLVRRKDSRGRVPALEILLNTPLMGDLILRGDIMGTKELIKKSNEAGMMTFDQSLFFLYENGFISSQEALRNADSINDLRLRMKLESKHSARDELINDTAGIGLEDPDMQGEPELK